MAPSGLDRWTVDYRSDRVLCLHLFGRDLRDGIYMKFATGLDSAGKDMIRHDMIRNYIAANGIYEMMIT